MQRNKLLLRTTIFLYISFGSLISIYSQSEAKNIRINQVDSKIRIIYDLERSDLANSYSVEAYYSTDNGMTYKEIISASGDVGPNISPGKNKTIIWEMKDEVVGYLGNMEIRIDANLMLKKVSFLFEYLHSLVAFDYEVYSPTEMNYNSFGFNFCFKNKLNNYNGLYLTIKVYNFDYGPVDSMYGYSDPDPEKGVGASLGYRRINKKKTWSMFFGGGVIQQHGGYNPVILEAGGSFIISKKISIPIKISFPPTIISAGVGILL